MDLNKVEMRSRMDNVHKEVIVLIPNISEAPAPLGRYHSHVALASVMW